KCFWGRIPDRDPTQPLNQEAMNALGQNPADDGLMVTHVNQTQDLLRLQGRDIPASALEDSEDWLSTHSLKSEKLTLTDLISQGTAVLEEHGNFTQKIHFSTQTICHFESKLHWSLMPYLMSQPEHLITTTRVGILIDVSAVSSGPQTEEFQTDLTSLIDEQLSLKEKLYVLSFGITAKPLWPDPVEVSTSTLQELKLWVKKLQPEGGSNLLQALKKVFTVEGLNSLVTIMGSCPDQPSEVLCDYIQQCTMGWDLFIHIITYKCDNDVPSAVLKNLADTLGGRYHCYSPESKLCTNRDVDELLAEIQKAHSLLRHVQALRHNNSYEELAGAMKEISTEIAKGPSTSLLPKPPRHDAPLTIEFPNLDKTSAEWLKTNSLKAKKLNLYQVLAPNAFSPVEEFVPILQKTVSSTVHERAMVQFEWHDGTVKNIHVDPPFLYEYQVSDGKMEQNERYLRDLVLVLKLVFLCRVVILLDVSESNSMYIIHIQHALRLLLEEQLSNKDYFNLIAFGSTTESWRSELVPVSHDHLQSAWRWALGLRCQGSRNVLSALRKAMEVDFKEKDQHQSQGIYLFTGGIPDQDVPTLSAYVAEACAGCDLQLNVCLFYVGEPRMDTTPPACYASRTDTATAYREIAQAAGGRFHWFGDTGIYESDDIKVIISEIEKALNYSQKCALLVASLKNNSRKALSSMAFPKDKPKTFKHREQPQRSCPSGPTAPSVTRTPSQQAKCPPAAAQPRKERTVVQRKPSKPRAGEAVLSLFYTDSGNNVGSVYKKYPQGRCARRTRSSVELPGKDMLCSSQEWVANYGLKKLKMEISRCLGPNCRHRKSAWPKSCSVVPSIEINGVVRHIRWTLQEMEAYITCMEKVMRRYVQRLQWLLSGSRRLFGSILESKVCILLDTSGSIGPYLQQLKTDLVLLIWEQLRMHCDSFNLLSFAGGLQPWRDTLVDSTDAACHEALQWVTRLQAQGSTSVFSALLKAFSFHDVQGLYLLTDGKPDTSCSLVLSAVQRLCKDRDVKVHTISLNCTDRAAVEFLRKLASLTGGRYHCPVDEDTLSGICSLLTRGFIEERDPTLPLFEGDDLRTLAQEINKARSFLEQAQAVRSHLQKKNNTEPNVTLC
uniref:von Willebrand factor A domain containing 3A n=1 Tax=Jaculus jaculus TaxID=51337 RepID=A0A8C5L8C2_JACJA